jgi:hypothetical protein
MSKEIVDILANIEKVSGIDLSRLQTVLESEFNTSGRDLDQTEDKRSEEAKRIVIKVIRNGVVLGVNYDVATKKLSFVDEEAKLRYKVLKDAIIFRSKVSLAKTLEPHVSLPSSVNIDNFKRLLNVLEKNQKLTLTDKDNIEILARMDKKTDSEAKIAILEQIMGAVSDEDEEIIKRYIDLIKEAYELYNRRLNIANYREDTNKVEVLDKRYEFKDPSRDDLAAYVAEWKRIWDLDPNDPDNFITVVDETLIRMEREIDDFMDRAKFTEKPVGTRYKALKTFFNNLGYSYDKDSGKFKGADTRLIGLYTYLHNRLSLADHAHLHGVSSSMYVNFESAFKATFPDFGRYVLDYFSGASLPPKEREKKAYEHYRVVRALDVLITGYYDETVVGTTDGKETGFLQEIDPSTGTRTATEINSRGEVVPKMEVYKTVYVVRDNEGNFIEEGSDESDLRTRYPEEDFIIEKKYGALFIVFDGNGKQVASGQDKAELKSRYPESAGYKHSEVFEDIDGTAGVTPGHYSFGRGRWMSSGGGYKTKMMARLKRDFACLPGVQRKVEDGKVVYYYGEDADRKKLPAEKLEEALNVTIAYNGVTASRAQVFTALYYAVGKSPNDDENLDLMYKCFPLAKELNLTKESVLEIPYIVLGGDIPNEWLADAAIKIGLCSLILSNETLRKKTGIQSQADFMEPIPASQNIDGAEVADIKGLRAIRDLEGHDLVGISGSDLPRFRNILRSIYISRLKRDLLKFQFATYYEDGEESEARLSGKYEMKITSKERANYYASGGHKGKDFLAPWVSPPRHVLSEYGGQESLDLSTADKTPAGLTAAEGLQVHSVTMEEQKAAAETYEMVNKPLPSLSGELKHDIEAIVEDMKSLLKRTSPMKKDSDMIDWVFFFELLQMRMTRLLIAHTEKHRIFQKYEKSYSEIMLRRKVSSVSIIDELHHYIESSGQTGVGGSELIYIPNRSGGGERVDLKTALLALIPNEIVEHGDRTEVVGSFWQNIAAVFDPTSKGYNENSKLAKARVSLYAGGIEQRSRILDIQGSPYENALDRYDLISFLDPDIAVLTNTGFLNEHSASVKKAKDAQAEEKDH